MRVSRNQRHRALCSLLLSSVGRNFSSSKTKEQWLQAREGKFSSPKGPLLLYATAPTFPKAGVALPPLDRMSSLCCRAGGWQQQQLHCPSARPRPRAAVLPSLFRPLGHLLRGDVGEGGCRHPQRLVLGRRQDWQDVKEKNKPGLSLPARAVLSTLT